MKNYDELTNDLLERRDRYVADQKKNRKRVMGVATSLCCFCLVALLGFGMWQGGMFNTTPPDQTLEDALYPGIKDYFDESKGESADNPAANNEIRILEIENLPDSSEKMFINLTRDDFIQMNHDEINEYYGVNIFPTVPSDLEIKEGQAFGIYKRKIGGELYYDGNKLQYSNEDFSRNLAVNVDKDCMPFDFCNLFSNIQTRSIINNVEIGIAQTPIGDMYAEFMYQNVGFRMYACGLTQDEFAAVITSIIK